MRTLFGGGAERRSNPFESPSYPLTDVGLLDIFGGGITEAGVSVSEETAMTFATVFRCVTMLSGLVAGFPFKCYRYADKSAVYVPALSPYTSGSTPFERWETVMIHLLLWGNAYLQKVRSEMGSIIELRPIHPSRVTPQRQTLTDDIGTPADKVFLVNTNAGNAVPYTTRDILHIPGPSFDGVTGMSPIGMARQSISIGLAGDRLAAKLFGNGSLLSGILTTDRVLTQDQSDQLKARWKAKVAGLSHGHDIAVMDAGTKFTPIAMPPEDAQFIQSRSWQTIETCRWFGVPPHLCMEMTKSTSWGTGIEQQNIGFLKFTIRNWLGRIEQRVTREVVEPKTQYAEFLVDDLLRSDTMQRYTAYSSGILSGWMTRNEARRKENLEPLEGLDEPLIPTVAPPSTVPAPAEDDEADTDSGADEDANPLYAVGGSNGKVKAGA